MKERNSEVDTYLYDIGVVFYIISSQADAFFLFFIVTIGYTYQENELYWSYNKTIGYKFFTWRK